MCPLKHLSKAFTHNEELLPVDRSEQHITNEECIPDITNDILDNRDNYDLESDNSTYFRHRKNL